MSNSKNSRTSDTRYQPKGDGAQPQLKGDRCQCPSCGEYFNSTYAFDRHRIGQIGGDRRCLVSAEMVAKGMAKNAAGFWVSQQMALGRGGKGKGPAFDPHPCGSAPRRESRRKSYGVTARVGLPREVGT